MTSKSPVLIVGAGGHAKVVIELFQAAGLYTIAGLVDADPTPRKVLGIDVIGSDADLPALRRSGIEYAFVALGDNRIRLNAAHALLKAGFRIVNAISPAAIISPTVQLGTGIAVMAGAVINADTRIGDFTIINTRASVDHDGNIGEAVHIAPGCAIAGKVTVGRLTFIGVGASAIDGIKIGEGAVIGAGACVVRDIPPGTVAAGVPARSVRVDEAFR